MQIAQVYCHVFVFSSENQDAGVLHKVLVKSIYQANLLHNQESDKYCGYIPIKSTQPAQKY